MALNSDLGQVDTGIFNDLLVAPHFADITLLPARIAPKEGAIAFDEKTGLLYYSRNYKWIPITSGGGSLVTPPGIVVQTTSPMGSTFTAVTIVSGNPAITVTNGNGVTGNPMITFNGETFPQGILAEQTGPNGTVVNGVTIVSLSPALVITNGNGVGGNPMISFNPGALPLPVLPQGLIAEQTGPSGNVYNGVTITSVDPELQVTNGNGVGGNPTLNINLAPQGLIPGGVVQNMMNYLGEIFNNLNGFSQYGTTIDLNIPHNSTTPLAPTDDGTTILHPYGFDGLLGNPGYTKATATYVVPTTTPPQAKVVYQIDATCTFHWVVGATGTLEMQVIDLNTGVNVDDSQNNGSANLFPGYTGGSLGFGGRYALIPGHSYQLNMVNTDGVQDATVTFWHWSMMRVQ